MAETSLCLYYQSTDNMFSVMYVCRPMRQPEMRWISQVLGKEGAGEKWRRRDYGKIEATGDFWSIGSYKTETMLQEEEEEEEGGGGEASKEDAKKL
jgi:hypothetical protein